VSQRHRHRYAADLPHGLPRLLKESSREVPAARSGGTHRARPVSTRFEPVHEIKDVTTPVPRVLLSATLAGPAPSGSTGHVPALSGLLPPSPAPPGSGCPQLHRPAATRRRRRSLTSTRTTAPRCAEWRSLAAQLLFRRDIRSHALSAPYARWPGAMLLSVTQYVTVLSAVGRPECGRRGWRRACHSRYPSQRSPDTGQRDRPC